jgi:hypothetical protein
MVPQSRWAEYVRRDMYSETFLPTVQLKHSFATFICSVYRSGTWMMTGNGVMHNGTTVIDEYGQNLDRLQVSIIVRGSNFPLKCVKVYE